MRLLVLARRAGAMIVLVLIQDIFGTILHRGMTRQSGGFIEDGKRDLSLRSILISILISIIPTLIMSILAHAFRSAYKSIAIATAIATMFVEDGPVLVLRYPVVPPLTVNGDDGDIAILVRFYFD